MPTKKLPPQTSIEAYYSILESSKWDVYKAVIETLSKVRNINSERIATLSKLPHERVWKRMSELEKFHIVKKTGERSLTSKKRSAENYELSQDVKDLVLSNIMPTKPKQIKSQHVQAVALSLF